MNVSTDSIEWWRQRCVSAQFDAMSDEPITAPVTQTPIPEPERQPINLSVERTVRLMAKMQRARA